MLDPHHRLMFNIDCNCMFQTQFPPLREGERFTFDRIRRYLDLLIDNGVDTVLMNANGQSPWYPSRAVPWVYDGYERGDRVFFRGHFPPTDEGFTAEMLEQRIDYMMFVAGLFLDLVEDGVDWFAEVAAHCRARGASPFVTLRMNDAHGANSWEHSFFNNHIQRDPQYRLSGKLPNPKLPPDPFKQVMNYEHEAVRDYHLKLVREVVLDYDYEGLELDWLRVSRCCEAPATEEALELMAGFFREVRAITYQKAKTTGKHYPVGLRIPARLGLLKSIGLDVWRLAEDGLIDWITPSNFFQTTWDLPYDRLRAELPEKVTIVGGIESVPNWVPAFDPARDREGYRMQTTSEAMLYANAAGKLAMGVETLECFNFFAPDEKFSARNPHSVGRQAYYPALRRLTDLKAMRGRVKHYALANMYGPWDYELFESAEQLPAVIEPRTKRAFTLSMCREPLNKKLRLVIELTLEAADELPDLGVSFNGCWPIYSFTPSLALLLPTGQYRQHTKSQVARWYEAPLTAIREGLNEVLVINDGAGGTSARILSLELALVPL